jgi:hypothetical protein
MGNKSVVCRLPAVNVTALSRRRTSLFIRFKAGTQLLQQARHIACQQRFRIEP